MGASIFPAPVVAAQAIGKLGSATDQVLGPVAVSGTGWVQVIASTSAEFLLTATTPFMGNSSASVGTLSVGTGASGSEVVIVTQAIWHDSSGVAGRAVVPIAIPARVAAGTRIAVKFVPATGAASGQIGVHVVLLSSVDGH